MALYIVIVCVLICLSFLEVSTYNRLFSQLGLMAGILFFFILSFIRWETGTDWSSYIEIFSWIKTPWDSLDNGMELGFTVINHLGKMLFDSYTGVLFLFAIILYSCTYKSTIYFSALPITTLLLSFCIVFANVFFVRQNIALAILMLALIFANENRWWRFFFLVLLAAQFHRTAWIFLCVYPVFGHYYKLRTIVGFLIISIIGSLLLSKFLFAVIGNLGLGVISQKIEMYLEMGTDDNTMAFSTTTILLKGLLNRVVLLTLFFILLNKERQRNSTVNGLLNIYILGTILYCATLPISISLARVAVYMDMVQIFLVPYALETQNKMTNRIILFGFFVLYYLFRMYASFTAYETAYVPFQTIFD